MSHKSFGTATRLRLPAAFVSITVAAAQPTGDEASQWEADLSTAVASIKRFRKELREERRRA